MRKALQDFQRLIQFTEELARKEKLILDIHAENIILSLPDFRLKILIFTSLTKVVIMPLYPALGG